MQSDGWKHPIFKLPDLDYVITFIHCSDSVCICHWFFMILEYYMYTSFINKLVYCFTKTNCFSRNNRGDMKNAAFILKSDIWKHSASYFARLELKFKRNSIRSFTDSSTIEIRIGISPEPSNQYNLTNVDVTSVSSIQGIYLCYFYLDLCVFTVQFIKMGSDLRLRTD